MKRSRAGFTLLEVLVAVGIVGALVGLLLPAILQVREGALRTESTNNLRQIGLAVQSFAGDHSGRLPSTSLGNEPSGDSLFFALLPYIEHGSYYDEIRKGTRQRTSDQVIRPYISPADPTITSARNAGLTSYAANAKVFGVLTVEHQLSSGTKRLTPLGRPGDISRSFPDGTSHSIMFAEHFAFIDRGADIHQFNWFTLDTGTPIPIPGPGGVKRVSSRRATFADVDCGDVVPVSMGNPPTTVASVRGLTFQVRPAIRDADPRIPQTPHPGGMLAAMGDGHVRTLARGMKETTFWALVTPAGGETVDTDW